MLAQTSFTVGDLNLALFVGALVIIVSVAAVRLAVRAGLPTLLIYLALGLLIGEGGVGVRFDSAELTQVLGYSALILILAEGGLTTSWHDIRPSVAPAAALSTVGVAVSVAVVGAGAHLLLHLPWNVAVLLGAVLASTDAAAVFSVLRQVPLPSRITGILEAESGFNDAPVVILVVALTSAATPGGHPRPWWLVLLLALAELAGGAVTGGAIGYAGGRAMARVASSSSALFAIGVLALTVLAYAVGDLAHSSGFLATYVCALVLGNLGLPHRAAVRSFGQAMGWLAQIGLFVLLGLLASPGRLVQQILPAVVIGLVLLLLGRPLSVVVSMTPFRIPWREQAFLSWAGLRGAVPVVLATVPLTMGTPRLGWLFDRVFVLVVVFTLVQGPTLPWVANRLGLASGDRTLDLEVEVTALDELGAQVLEVRVGERSLLHGVAVFELRLPAGADVTLVVRDGESFVPAPRTLLRRGDALLVVATTKSREAAERRLRLVSAGGRLAGWRAAGNGQPGGAGGAHPALPQR